MLRRTFLGLLGAAGVGAALGKSAHAAGHKEFTGYPGSFGVLFDATRCIGCRRCEAGCNKVNELPAPARPFDDLSVLDEKRRTHAKTYTVVNRYDNIPGAAGPVYPQEAVQPLPGAGLRLVLLRAGLHQDRAGRGDLGRHGLRGLPLLHDRLPLRDSDLRIQRAADAPDHEVHPVLSADHLGQADGAGLRGRLPRGGPGLRQARRPDQDRPGALPRLPGPLPEPDLRRARDGRHQLALSLGRALQALGHAGRPGHHAGAGADLRGPGRRAHRGRGSGPCC